MPKTRTNLIIKGFQGSVANCLASCDKLQLLPIYQDECYDYCNTTRTSKCAPEELPPLAGAVASLAEAPIDEPRSWCTMTHDTPLYPFDTGCARTATNKTVQECAQWCMEIDATYGCELWGHPYDNRCCEVVGPISSLGKKPGWGNWGCFRGGV